MPKQVRHDVLLFNQAMIFLQTLNSTFTTVTVLNRLYTLNSSKSTCKCSDVAYLVFETSLADCLAVFGVVAFGFWGVDYEANIFVHHNNEGESLPPGFNRFAFSPPPFA